MGSHSLSQVIKRMKESESKVITPVIDDWLVNHPEGITVPPELMDVVQMLLSSPNSDRSARFGASARGTCQRRQVFGYLGMPPLLRMDPTLQNLFNDGTWRHIRWQLMGLLAGIFVNEHWNVPQGVYGSVDNVPIEVTHTLKQYHVKVSTDGENQDDGWGFELKGMSFMGKVIDSGSPPPFHMAQVHTYFVATGFDRFIYVAEDKRSNDWKEIVVREDPAITRQVKDELNALSDAVEDEVLPPILPACRAGAGDDFKNCPFRHACREQGNVWPVEGQWSPVVLTR